VALPAFAVARRAAARLLLTAGRAAIDQHLLPAVLTAANTQQMRRPYDGTDGRQTDRRTPESYIAPARYTVRAYPVIKVYRRLSLHFVANNALLYVVVSVVQEKDERPPEFLQSLQITKTRAGMQVR